MDTYKKIYNITAELCSFIIKICPEDFFVEFSCISTAERKRITAIVNSTLPELISKDEKPHLLSESELNENFFKKLESLISSLKEQQDFFSLTGLLQAIDNSLENILKNEIHYFQQEDFDVALNSNRESTGIGLLPRCECCWERKRRLSHCYNRLDNYLFNLLLMENSILGELIDKHIFLKDDFFKNFNSQKLLKIAATPLRNKKNFSIQNNNDEKIQSFDIEYDVSTQEEDNNLIWEKILRSSRDQADIIVFPEILGNQETESFIITKLKSLSEEESQKMPSMIILPSFWYKKRNVVSVLDRHGNILCHQAKQNPFRFESNGTGFLEGIIASSVINIFHCEGIGRMAILICKDFITTRYMEQLMRCFKLTLIIVPSFSTGSYDFRQSFDICAHDDCNVVWINTCAAMEKGKEDNFSNIGYVRKRIGRYDDESLKLSEMPVCQNALKGICDHSCIFFETINSV